MKSGRRNIPLLIIAVWLLIPGLLQAQSYGLQFASRDAVPEKRTSLNLTPREPICMTNNLQLSFDITFPPNGGSYFGYVFRVINDRNQNLDLLYDQNTLEFRIVFGDGYTDINYPVNPTELLNKWINFRLEIDEHKGITLYGNNRLIKTSQLNFTGKCLHILFGASNQAHFVSSDVTPMKVRNIRVLDDGRLKYYWPLNESSGTAVRDSLHQQKAEVTNPYWVMPQHTDWQLVNSLLIRGTPSVALNAADEELYINSRDTFYTLYAKTGRFMAEPLTALHHNLLPGNQSIYNPYNQTLYNFYTDQKRVMEYNFVAHQWDSNFAAGPVTEYWHVNKFFSDADSSLYVMAGYGQLRYKNIVHRYSLVKKTWETVRVGGDYFSPRYLSALGATADGDTAYILGGYGSKDGDQLLNPRYYYDLLLFDVKRKTFKKIYTLKEPAEPFVFANSMILDADGKHYYALILPKDWFDTRLQLIRGSLTEPTYELLGKSFPYSFYDNRSFADLYYCPQTKLLLATTLFTNKDSNTEVKIYSIHFPPNSLPVVNVAEADNISNILLYIIAGLTGLFVLVVAGYYIQKWMRGSHHSSAPALPSQEVMALGSASATQAREAVTTAVAGRGQPSSEPVAFNGAQIYLFGNFEVMNQQGENLTRLFTPLLKELFLLLSIHSIRYGKGVSPEKLIETLWSDKDTKDAINNRSVNIAKLKSILEKIDGCALVKEAAYYKIEFDPAKVYIDFARYAQVFAIGRVDDSNIDDILRITNRGGFLPQANYQWLDSFKSEIGNFIVDALLKYCNSLPIADHAEKIITICNSIFFFDELNENALKLKCRSLVALGRHTLAKNTFEKFLIQYKAIYGEDYREGYTTIIS